MAETSNNESDSKKNQPQAPQTPQRAANEGALEQSGIATPSENKKLEHSKGGTTTRDDALDLGVPMLPGSPNEPQGPEDALGPGPKRGDYSQRVGPQDYHPHITVPVENPEPGEATVKVVPQRPFASEVGEVPGKKGGVETSEGSIAGERP